ncbi:uncharacterized protein isoform X3 [Choristoneura fumiferana]|uniref:uncharacterized protein isoform X3 n=1 Tax=Choristoneura fumiferana TaxID=7141 RepID=UPI003D153F1D
MKILLLSWVLLVLGVTLNSGHYIYKVEKEDAPPYEVESNLKGLVLVNSKFENPSLKGTLYRRLLGSSYGKEEPLNTERPFTNSHGLPFLEDFEKEHNSQNDVLEDIDNGLFKAYKSKSYIFDQMRQRSDAASEDFIERRKRTAEIPYFPLASQMSMYRSRREPFAPPDTYGMNLNQNGGYVWNNLNNSPSLYELSTPSNVYETTQSEDPPQTSETPAFTSAPEETPITSSAPEHPDSGSSEDIYVNIIRSTPATEGISIELKEVTEEIKENNEKAPNYSDAFEPRELTVADTTETGPEEPEGKAIEITESTVASVSGISSQEVKTEEVTPAPTVNDVVKLRTGAESSSVGPDEFVTNTGDASGNSEGDQVKEMPEAPTLRPLNYDGLPDYIRESISTTERQNNQTDNPFLNPQPGSEDKDMEGIIVTAQPVEDIPKTYGMNLTSSSGKVWNDLVNPPVSFEVGSTESNQSQEPKETTQAPTVTDEPVTAEPKTETPAEETEKDKVPAIPEENITPIDMPEVTEQPEAATNEPNLMIPGTEKNDESITTELPTTSETPEISESTEPDVKSPETENPASEAPVTEYITPVTDLPEILSTTEETVTDDNKSNDDIEPVTTVMPDEEPEGPEVEEPEFGSEETGDGDEVSEPEVPISTDKLDIMNELLKSEQFWAWLGEWMSAYTELLKKHIRKIAIQEICNARHGDICPLDKPDSGSIVKDGKVTVNGKEIDLNDLNQLRRGNKGHSVDATTIYGNSVGNDKVTNVFIFNPDNAKDIIEGLKPENSSNVNIIIEENKEEDKGSIEVTAIPAIPEVENKEITEDAGIEDRKNEAGAEVPKEGIEGTTEKQVESVGADERKSEDVKEVEKVTEAVELKDQNVKVADVEAVKLKSSELSVENVTEAKLQ